MPYLKSYLKYALYGFICTTIINVACLITYILPLWSVFLSDWSATMYIVRHYFMINIYIAPYFTVLSVLFGFFREKHQDNNSILIGIFCSLAPSLFWYCVVMFLNMLPNIAGVEITSERIAFLFYQQCWPLIVAGIFLMLIRQIFWKFVLLMPLFVLFLCHFIGEDHSEEIVTVYDLRLIAIIVAMIIAKVLVEMILERIKSKRVVPASS